MIDWEMDKNKIEQFLIDICLKIARQGKGCLFIIKEHNFDYDILIEQDIKSFSIFDNQRRVELLALHSDGACVIDLEGNLISYGAKIKDTETLKGFGTRHSAAYTASLKGNDAILASEEDRKVRIFKNGKIMQVDPFEKNISIKVQEAVNFFDLLPKSLSVGVVGAVGTSIVAAVPIGIVLIPGVTVFATGYMVAQLVQDYLKRKEITNGMVK